jgi:hypothetical protein
LGYLDAENMMFAIDGQSEQLARIAVGQRAPRRAARPRQRTEVRLGEHSFEEAVRLPPADLL